MSLRGMKRRTPSQPCPDSCRRRKSCRGRCRWTLQSSPSRTTCIQHCSRRWRYRAYIRHTRSRPRNDLPPEDSRHTHCR
eukprot:scaffold130400_cov63-Phaeocystis_antarctica.AAC.5